MSRLNKSANKKKLEFHKRVLLVCEGEKTEIYYFENLKKECKLQAKTIEVQVEHQYPDPMNIVKRAKELNELAIEEDTGEYDYIYCVFDYENKIKAGERNFNGASQRAKDLGFKLARSWPCFEYWYLLHYKKIDRQFRDAKDCKKELIKYMPKYEKNMIDLYTQLKNRLSDAKKRADGILRQVKINGENPSTEVHLLVDKLETLYKASQK